MKYTRKFLTIIIALVMLTGLAAISASAQRRRGVRVVKRPIIVKHYYPRYRNPFRYWNYWGDPYFYGYYDPYLEAQRQRYYLQRELRGNREELRKHLEKYNADGVITDKERRELADDYRDVERAQRRLNQFNRNY